VALKELIFAAEDRQVDRTEIVDEWGVTVGFRVMSGRARDAFESATLRNMRDGEVVSTTGLRSLLLVETLVDSEGSPVFTKQDIRKLEEKSSVVLDRLNNIAKEVNGLDSDSGDDAEKNSESDPSDKHGSSSAPSSE
jgi:hypothetical protein